MPTPPFYVWKETALRQVSMLTTMRLFGSSLIFCGFFADLAAKIFSRLADTSHPCTYFNGARYSSPEGNLVNCSWYAGNACCKRTEVTSVFGGMYPLLGASRDCSNHMNYLMCYFCSPQQYIWYMSKANVCGSFCKSVFEHCRSAQYSGKMIGEMYTDSRHFCQGQQFSVVDGDVNCFSFDPSVFGRTTHSSTFSFLSFLCILAISLCNIDIL